MPMDILDQPVKPDVYSVRPVVDTPRRIVGDEHISARDTLKEG